MRDESQMPSQFPHLPALSNGMDAGTNKALKQQAQSHAQDAGVYIIHL